MPKHPVVTKPCELCGYDMVDVDPIKKYHDACKVDLQSLRGRLRDRYKYNEVPEQAQYQFVHLHDTLTWLIQEAKVRELKRAYGEHHAMIEDMLINLDIAFTRLEGSGWKGYNKKTRLEVLTN